MTDPIRPAPCPICGKPAHDRFRPFCSARCKQVDLGRWFGERYSVETEETPEDQPDQSA
jgi:endogenous inhibitor of DNA gyrase (YacG/DUF329 family)